MTEKWFLKAWTANGDAWRSPGDARWHRGASWWRLRVLVLLAFTVVWVSITIALDLWWWFNPASFGSAAYSIATLFAVVMWIRASRRGWKSRGR